MKTRLFALSFLAIFAVACNQTAVDGAQTTVSNADSATATATDQGTQEAAATSEEPIDVPALKPADVQEKLKKLWDDAATAEKALLGSPKLLGWIDGLQSTTDEDGFDQPGKLTDKQFNGLSTKEQYLYYLLHPEEASQNCSMAYFEAGLIQGISRYLPISGEEYPSERQTSALQAKRAEVVDWTKKCINSNKAISVPMMQAIVAFQMKEVIQPLIDLYNAQPLKDDLLLSTMIELMSADQFPAWQNSQLVTEMGRITNSEYGEPADYAPLTDENIAEVIALAKQFAAS